LQNNPNTLLVFDRKKDRFRIRVLSGDKDLIKSSRTSDNDNKHSTMSATLDGDECCDGIAAMRRGSDEDAEYKKIVLVLQSIALYDTISRGSLDQV